MKTNASSPPGTPQTTSIKPTATTPLPPGTGLLGTVPDTGDHLLQINTTVKMNDLNPSEGLGNVWASAMLNQDTYTPAVEVKPGYKLKNVRAYRVPFV